MVYRITGLDKAGSVGAKWQLSDISQALFNIRQFLDREDPESLRFQFPKGFAYPRLCNGRRKKTWEGKKAPGSGKNYWKAKKVYKLG